ncbi:gamma-glutamyltransferase [Ectothiorhodospira haloalkaliphila]|uniref:gamma-glutamyltransferase n=1 Tax=Ectothiorhodospira haloalkaliphila TaxID=421628 RepID=UPI001EE8F222|nr:gamma-glutamyltransferase [Ectothiorhodospira haloalkaliphila]MCG5524090.1 gamma-glutamyltransferase [Ectothiorhodospira haloalkaliphila]
MSRSIRSLVLLICLACAGPLLADAPPHGVATPHPLATEVALEVLARGGNAFDAAVAVGAALAVVEPYGSGLGGGGFWLLHEAATGRQVMVDARERAPLAADADMFLDDEGEVDRDRVMNGPLAAAIPGTPAALDHIVREYGALPLTTLLEPAIRLAREGFPVDPVYERLTSFRRDTLRAWPASAAVFLDDGEVPEEGFVIHQPDLARTLERLADSGRDGFYRGPVAERLVEAVSEAGGIWTQEDLASYQVVEREPISFDYRGMRVVSAPPPSSGGIALAQAMQMMERFDLEAMDEADRLHHGVEAMRLAYHDRARYLGDVDFVEVPVERLIDPRYAAGLAATVHPGRARPSEQLPGPAGLRGGEDTTHFSIIDAQGNRVSATLSLNYPFGSGFMPAGTGVVLNNHMDDFTAAPGTPNAYGLIQSSANRIEPGKRMLSSMSPTFLEMDDRVAALGTPGGSRIITMVLLSALDFHAGGGADRLVSSPRHHHQYLPDYIEYEPDAFSDELKAQLEAYGHVLEARSRPWGNLQAVVVETDGRFEAAADPRGVGTASAAGLLHPGE